MEKLTLQKIRWLDEDCRYVPTPEADHASKTPFDILGCTDTDSDDTIKRRYRKLALQYHPDRWKEFMVPWATKQLQAVNVAYDEITVARTARTARKDADAE